MFALLQKGRNKKSNFGEKRKLHVSDAADIIFDAHRKIFERVLQGPRHNASGLQPPIDVPDVVTDKKVSLPKNDQIKPSEAFNRMFFKSIRMADLQHGPHRARHDFDFNKTDLFKLVANRIESRIDHLDLIDPGSAS